MSGTPMVAVLADVHGNYPALRACLDYARRRGATHYLFLGDYITDHPYPERTLALLRQTAKSRPCRFIRGNREEYMLNHRTNPNEWKEGSCQGALLCCYERLGPEDLAWFEQLPIAGSWRLEGAPPLAYCHGSPEQVRGEMRGDPASLAALGRLDEDFLIKGHNHRVWSICFRGKRVVCAGSVGNPIQSRSRRAGPEATPLAKAGVMTFLTVREEAWYPEAAVVPYDWRETLDNLESSGLTKRAPVWAAMLRHNVLTGQDPFAVVPRRAVWLYQRQGGRQVLWPQVPEKYWRRAAEEFGIELYPRHSS